MTVGEKVCVWGGEEGEGCGEGGGGYTIYSFIEIGHFIQEVCDEEHSCQVQQQNSF